ncbi:MAG TPA: DUF438 domain-containing protein [Dissulfurispiraceae bacterium]|nr:DUF438 domain-containing protein [Dissulfurispiraceae bacterium]
MDINSKTKVNDLLTRYPFLKDFLIRLNPEFKMLDNPFMRKTVGRIASIGKAAMIGGMDVKKLLDDIAAEIKSKTGEAVSVAYGEGGPDEQDVKIDKMKEIIKELHAGKDAESQKKKFEELIKDVAPWEIAQMEQKLIAEGMPETEIKNLCEVHVQVFKEALEHKTVPGLPAGHPVHTLMLENRAAEDILKEIESVTDYAKDKDKLLAVLDRLAQIDKHYLRKENQLFPIVEAKGITGPSKVMWALHDDIRSFIKDVRKRVGEGKMEKVASEALVKMVNDMIYKEEHILFPMALETLSEEEWAKVRKGEEEIGFAWIKPEADWKPAAESFQQALLSEKVGSLNLDTGQLTAEQVNLLLTHLPVDLSFVNENDEVAYYSATPERIFPRSPGVIGRKVQNCHPPKSVDMVEKILASFKAGTKNVAEFWIQMRGRVLHIRYFAVRDAGGKYRGCLEVSQDVTEIQKLTGQKRLLDWE